MKAGNVAAMMVRAIKSAEEPSVAATKRMAGSPTQKV